MMSSFAPILRLLPVLVIVLTLPANLGGAVDVAGADLVSALVIEGDQLGLPPGGACETQSEQESESDEAVLGEACEHDRQCWAPSLAPAECISPQASLGLITPPPQVG